VLRLCQISGLTEMFSNSNFSQAWDVEAYGDDSLVELNDKEDVAHV